MTIKHSSAVLAIALSCILCMPAEAQTSSNTVAFPSGTIGCGCGGEIIGGAIGVIAGAAVIAIVAVHYSKKRSITGCVVSQGGGMAVIDEKDQHSYVLSGNTAGITPGNRVKVEGKKVKPKPPDQTLAWKTNKVSKNFGVCQP